MEVQLSLKFLCQELGLSGMLRLALPILCFSLTLAYTKVSRLSIAMLKKVMLFLALMMN